LIFASLAGGVSEIQGLLESEDTLATLRACEQLGARVKRGPDGIFVTGTGGRFSTPADGCLDMGNSGTAMRLLAGVLAGQGIDCELSGDASLNSRPMNRIIKPLRLMGANISANEKGTAPLRIRASAGLTGIDYNSPVASAQIKSCVLLAGLFASGLTRVREPRLSRDHTERMLPLFGVDLPEKCTVQGGSRLTATRFAVPGDISSAVFMLAAAAMTPGSDVTVMGVGLNPTRTGFLRCLEMMGADIRIDSGDAQSAEPVGDVRVKYRGGLKGIDVPAEFVPDMIDEMPLLMALAATATGTTRIRGAEELRVKESDRIAVMADGLRKMGIDLKEYPDGADIHPGEASGGLVESAHDHRCAMSFAVLAQVASAGVRIRDAQYIATSYPGFTDDLGRLGAQLEMEAAV
jgi:3-phosphoshikimate 1-carboxyvinyltransferase